jgi:hypothetical protein
MQLLFRGVPVIRRASVPQSLGESRVGASRKHVIYLFQGLETGNTIFSKPWKISRG